MDNTLRRLDDLIRQNHALVEAEAAGRTRLLWTAALVAVGFGIGCLASLGPLASSPSFGPAVRYVPGWPWLIIVLAFAGGVTLMVGLWGRSLGWQIAGSVMVTVVYAVMLFTFAFNNADWIAVWWVDETAVGRWMADASLPLTSLSGELRERALGPRPAVYPLFVYVHLTASMATLSVTCWRLRVVKQ